MYKTSSLTHASGPPGDGKTFTVEATSEYYKLPSIQYEPFVVLIAALLPLPDIRRTCFHGLFSSGAEVYIQPSKPGIYIMRQANKVSLQTSITHGMIQQIAISTDVLVSSMICAGDHIFHVKHMLQCGLIGPGSASPTNLRMSDRNCGVPGKDLGQLDIVKSWSGYFL